MRRDVLLRLSVVAVLAVPACTAGGSAAAPAEPAPARTHTPSATAATADAVVREVTYGDVPLTVAVHPVERVGETALLTVEWTAPRTAPRDDPIHLAILMSAPSAPGNLGSLRLVDLDASWVASPGTAGSRYATSGTVSLRPGDTVTSEALFAAPPGDDVDLLLPFLGLVPDVPVVDGPGDAPSPDDLEVPEGATYPAATLESFSAAFDQTATASVAQDAAVLTLASDVLFATDESALTPEAAAAVDDAARRIAEAAAAGEVRVVGHTDDVASDAYNLDLSSRRADAVAERLRPALGQEFTVRTEGRGETEPAVPGTSPEARAANRRVEVAFTAQRPGALVEVASAPVPQPAGAVGSGHDPVAVEVDDGRYEVTVERVVRRDGYLVGTLAVVRRSPTGEVRLPFVPTTLGPQDRRGFDAVSRVAGGTAVTLAGQGSWIYPVDHRTGAPDDQPVRRSVLADRLLLEPFNEAGLPVTATVVWPDAGQDAVTVDVHGRFRVTDVPVEEGR